MIDNHSEPKRAYIVFVLFLCFTCSYIDRQVVSILVQPIKRSMALSDIEIGLLQGLAFTLCYATAGVFIAGIADRSNRVRLIAACVTLWALSTILCGFADNFPQLLLARAGTAIAEAGLPAAAVSIFSDLYPARKVARATAVFMLGPYLGGGVALLGGGALVSRLEHDTTASSLLSCFTPWQLTFISVGVPGLLLASLVATTIREPERKGLMPDSGRSKAPPSYRDMLKALLVTHRFCAPYFAAYIAVIVLFYSQAAWFPTLTIRKFGLSASEAGRLSGPIYMLCGIAGVASSGWLASRAKDMRPVRRILAMSGIAATVLIPASVAVSMSTSLVVTMLMYGVCALSSSMVLALAPVPLQIVLPNRMRGRSVALLTFLTNTIGGGGPILVGALAQRHAASQSALAVALAVTCATSASCGALLYGLAARLAGRSVGNGAS
jgi:MFS family permease